MNNQTPVQIYTVRYWDNNKVHSTHTDPNKAKRVCRKLGHTGENNPGLTGYPPIAFVSTNEGWGEGCWYNPRFKK